MLNKIGYRPYTKINFTNNPQSVVQHENTEVKPFEENSKRTKTGIAATVALSVSAMLALIAKKQGFSLNPKKIFTTSPKEWAIFKIIDPKKPDSKNLRLEGKEILAIGGASVVGGLVGGEIFAQKSDRKARLQESLSQFAGNIAIPLTFVALPSKWYNKNEAKIQEFVPQFKNAEKSGLKRGMNKFMRILPPTAMTFGFLGAGIIAGNKVSNFINEKLYHKKVEREIVATDFAPHIDDLCLAVTLMAPDAPIGSAISKLIPFALMVAGNKVGNYKEG